MSYVCLFYSVSRAPFTIIFKISPSGGGGRYVCMYMISPSGGGGRYVYMYMISPSGEVVDMFACI